MIRAVFDTVVLRAYINPASRWGRLLAQHTATYRLVVSPPIVAEYLDVLLRPELTGRFASLAGLQMANVFGLLAGAEVVRVVDIPTVCRDPNDDKFFAAATTGQASYIVSEDRDVLAVGEYEGIKVIAAETFLKLLNEQTTTPP